MPAGVVLDGFWEITFSEFAYPSSFSNVHEGNFDFFWPTKRKWTKGCEIPTSRYRTASDIVLTMEKAIKQKLESDYGEKKYLEYELKFELFRPAEGVLFTKTLK